MTPSNPSRRARSAGMSRRRFLTLSGLAAAAAACGGVPGLRPGPQGDALASDSLRILNWELYIDPTEDGEDGTIDRFVDETGIPTTYDEEYEDNYEALSDLFEPTLGTGGTLDHDIVVPTYWVAQRLIENGWLDEVPVELIPNRANLDPTFLGMPWDRGARFHLPWQVGITGIAYDPALTGFELRSVRDLLDPRLQGRVGFVGEMREAVGLFMLADGDDPSAANPDAGHRALDVIEQAAPSVRFGFGELAEDLAAGDIAATMMWSGDMMIAMEERPDLQFVIPDEGAIRWFDTMVIPRGAANPGAAGRFMDFVYDPANAAAITAYVQYISPVRGVRDELAAMGMPELAESPILFPDDETSRRLRTWGGMRTDLEDELDDRFSEIAGL